jgi:hypothetical protein
MRTLGKFNTRLAPWSWLAGPLAATGTFVVLGFVSFGFYASRGGLLLAGTLAFMIGNGTAALVDPRPGRNAGIVAGYIAVLFAIYLLILPALWGPSPPGATDGGPAVSPPR